MSKKFVFILIVILTEINISCKGPQGDIGLTGRQGPSGKDATIDLNKGLICYYPFSGNAVDSSGNGYDGTVYNATLTSDRFGNENSAYKFDGVSSYINCGKILNNVFSKPIAQFSISGWAKTLVSSTSNLIIGKTAGGSGPYQWSVSHIGTSLCAGVMSDSNAHNYQTRYVTMGTDQWFHFVMIFDGSMPQEDRIRIYVNNTSVMYLYGQAGSLGTSTQNTSLDLTIGGPIYNSQTPYSVYNGVIDDIRIYNRVLSLAEIQALYFSKY